MLLDAGAITQKLARLAEADPDRKIFGAADHGYRPNPIVDPATMRQAEQALGARLPDEYRWFLTTVGDGGAGPYYGVITLADALDRVDEWLGETEALGQDCPLTTDVCFRELIGGPADWDAHVARLGSDPDYSPSHDRLREKYLASPWVHGRLPIVDYGCGDWFFLVARGPRRGTVWVDSIDSATGLYCLEVDFVTFYQRWLDDALEHAQRQEYRSPTGAYSYLRYGDNPRYRG